MQLDHLNNKNALSESSIPLRPNSYHPWRSDFDNHGRNSYETLGVGRRHANVQKGIQQNGIGNSNIQKDELAWRRGKLNTLDLQENVQQNGLGKRNNISLRRINEMMRNLFYDKNDKMNTHRNRTKNRNRQGYSEKKDVPSRRSGKEEQRNENQFNQANRSFEALQEQINKLKAMLCEVIQNFCNINEKKAKRAIDKVDHRIQDRNISSAENGITSIYNRRSSKSKELGEYHSPIMFLPNYEIALN